VCYFMLSDLNSRNPQTLGLVVKLASPVHAIWGMNSVPGQG